MELINDKDNLQREVKEKEEVFMLTKKLLKMLNEGSRSKNATL